MLLLPKERRLELPRKSFVLALLQSTFVLNMKNKTMLSRCYKSKLWCLHLRLNISNESRKNMKKVRILIAEELLTEIIA